MGKWFGFFDGDRRLDEPRKTSDLLLAADPSGVLAAPRGHA